MAAHRTTRRRLAENRRAANAHESDGFALSTVGRSTAYIRRIVRRPRTEFWPSCPPSHPHASSRPWSGAAPAWPRLQMSSRRAIPEPGRHKSWQVSRRRIGRPVPPAPPCPWPAESLRWFRSRADARWRDRSIRAAWPKPRRGRCRGATASSDSAAADRSGPARSANGSVCPARAGARPPTARESARTGASPARKV